MSESIIVIKTQNKVLANCIAMWFESGDALEDFLLSKNYDICKEAEEGCTINDTTPYVDFDINHRSISECHVIEIPL